MGVSGPPPPISIAQPLVITFNSFVVMSMFVYVVATLILCKNNLEIILLSYTAKLWFVTNDFYHSQCKYDCDGYV